MALVFEKVFTSPESSFRYLRRSERIFPFRWHYHPEFELTAIVSGHGRRLVGDDVADYCAGDLVFTGPDLPHTWHSTEAVTETGNDAVVIQFPYDFIGDGFFKSKEVRHIGNMFIDSARGICFGSEARGLVWDEMMSLGEYDGFERLLVLLRILDQLARTHDKRILAGESYSATPSDRDNSRFNKVYQFIHDEHTNPIKVEQVAKLLNMSPSGFSRFFKKVSGRSFVTCLNEFRVGTACRLLAETDMTVTEICYESGYQNLSNFNRQFLKLKKVNPRAYRAELMAG